jgi:hypothetical protein
MAILKDIFKGIQSFQEAGRKTTGELLGGMGQAENIKSQKFQRHVQKEGLMIQRRAQQLQEQRMAQQKKASEQAALTQYLQLLMQGVQLKKPQRKIFFEAWGNKVEQTFGFKMDESVRKMLDSYDDEQAANLGSMVREAIDKGEIDIAAFVNSMEDPTKGLQMALQVDKFIETKAKREEEGVEKTRKRDIGWVEEAIADVAHHPEFSVEHWAEATRKGILELRKLRAPVEMIDRYQKELDEFNKVIHGTPNEIVQSYNKMFDALEEFGIVLNEKERREYVKIDVMAQRGKKSYAATMREKADYIDEQFMERFGRKMTEDEFRALFIRDPYGILAIPGGMGVEGMGGTESLPPAPKGALPDYGISKPEVHDEEKSPIRRFFEGLFK